MSRIDAIVADARARGLRPWLAVKEQLAACAVRAMAPDSRAVLQGGAALHFEYGSPRLSADVDFVGLEVGAAIEGGGKAIAEQAADALGVCAVWSVARSGRLLRGKVTLEVGPARTIVLPVEGYEVPARRVRTAAAGGAVEEPVEIAADKIVASADRLARRGALKTRDLYDLWFIQTRLGAAPPEPELVAQKADDYAQPRRGADLGAAVRAVSPEELREALDGVLPAELARSLDPEAILQAAADLVDGYRDVL